MSIIKKYLNVKNAIGSIQKDATNPFAKSKYATLSTILKHINPFFEKEGLVVLFKNVVMNESLDNVYSITVQIINTDDTKDLIETTFDIPYDTTQKNPVQGFGSTATYGQRYIYAMLFGIPFDDEDPDAQKNGVNAVKVGKKPIQKKETAQEYYNKYIKPIFDTNSELKNIAKSKGLNDFEQLKHIHQQCFFKKIDFVTLIKNEQYKTLQEIKDSFNN